MHRLLRGYQFPEPSVDDWRNIFRPVKYVFDKSSQARCVKLLLMLVGLVNLGSIVDEIAHAGDLLSLNNAIPILWMLLIFVGILIIGLNKLSSTGAIEWIIFMILVVGWAIGAVLGSYSNSVLGAVISGIVVAVCSTILYLVTDYSASLITKIIGGGFLGAIYGVIFGVISWSFFSKDLWPSIVVGAAAGLFFGMIGTQPTESRLVSGVVSGVGGITVMVIGRAGAAGGVFKYLLYLPTLRFYDLDFAQINRQFIHRK